MKPRRLLWALAIGVITNEAIAAKYIFVHTQFQHWYPQAGEVFPFILERYCVDEMQTYLHGNESLPFDNSLAIWKSSRAVNPLINCLLNHTTEFTKSNMASAQVILGLTPGILSLLGPSLEEIGVLGVIGRRPLLSLLIVAGIPAVIPRRAFGFDHPAGVLREHEGRLHRPAIPFGSANFLTLVEYVAAGLSIANLAHVCYWLGIRSISNIAPEITWLPALWTWLGIVPYITSCCAMMLRVKISKSNAREGSSSTTLSMRRFLAVQFTPLSTHEPMRFSTKNNSYSSLALSWLASIMVILHVIYGTACFSSLLFISALDSLTVITRYLASAIVSRMVLMCELAVLRDSHIKALQIDSESRVLSSEAEKHQDSTAEVPPTV